MKCFWKIGWVMMALLVSTGELGASAVPERVLLFDKLTGYVRTFNHADDEAITNHISNADSLSWLQRNIPTFECPDREVEEMYYFRWWSFRKHLRKTPEGFVLTEFLTPVKHAGIYNTISSAAALHVEEGRWLRDSRYIDDYTRFWFAGNKGKAQPHFHNFSSWLTSAGYERYLVNHDQKFVTGLLREFVSDYRAWEKERQLLNGLFWQYDVKDAMEESISGSRTNKNIRPTINSYMFANAQAIAAIAWLAGKSSLATEFAAKAENLKHCVKASLWNTEKRFFTAQLENGDFSDAREEIGFLPWKFGLAQEPTYAVAWSQFIDPLGFQAPFGITTAERRHPDFRANGFGKCEWDGAVWPFATSQTLGAMANLLRGAPQDLVNRENYFDAFLTYVHSQHANGKPYIGEYLDETTGDWINGKEDRSRYYNHSTFADLLITGIVGLVPRNDDVIELHPLLPPNVWNWFCLDGVKYHGAMLTIIWDKGGSRYRRGTGLRLLVNGKVMGHSATLAPMKCRFP